LAWQKTRAQNLQEDIYQHMAITHETVKQMTLKQNLLTIKLLEK